MRLSLLLLPLGLATALVGAESAPHFGVTKEGIRFAWLGEKPAQPAPTVFFIAGAIENNFSGPQFTEAIRTLGPGVLCVSLDAPGFGQDRRDGEPNSIPTWRYRLDRGEDFTAGFRQHASAVLDHLIAEHFTDPGHVAAFGTSRGGFLSFQLAAADARITHVAGFAPVTDLLALTEFAQMKSEQPARALAAVRLADRLAERRLWVIIGSTDFRVSTARAIEFSQRVVDAALAQGRAPTLELHVQPSDGHHTPPGAYEAGARWLLQQWSLPEKP